MKYEVRLKPVAEKALKKIPKDYYYRILVALSDIATNPFIGKKLENK